MLRLFDDFGRDPLRIGEFAADVMTRSCVFLMYLREMICLEAVRYSDQGRPKPAVNEGQLSIDEATNHDVG